MRTRSLIGSVLLSACALGACGSSAGAPDAAMRDARPALDAGPLVDPAAFDCRATTTPARVSPLPLSCPIDRACAGMRIASSHRVAGAPSVIAPENTLSAIRAAIAHGADLVEMDVRPTSDGTLVLMHDAEVDRTTTGTGRVDAMTLEQVRTLGIRADGLAGDFSCERVPTFAEALALADERIVIVVDASKTDRVDLMVADIQAAGAVDRVVFDTADEARIEAALALEPGLRFLVRASTEAELTDRLDALAPALPVYVHIDVADPAVMAPLVHGRDLRVFALGFGADVTATLRGPDAYAPLYESGIDMLQSNRIDLLGTFLERL